MASFFVGTLRIMETRTLPTIKQPPSHVRLLENAIETLQCKYAINDVAGDLKEVLEGIRTALELTRFGDCLFADEFRNILLVVHCLPNRRGTDDDPLRGKRKCHRKRNQKS